MSEPSDKKIYFHVGTGKTGTTFLQYRIFPKFKGIYYIQRTQYRRVNKIINRTNYTKYLISREFDQQLEEQVKLFAADFPDTIPIIVFRRHDDYIASQYRRFVKNGFTGRFTDFFDVENDKGYFRKTDLDYSRQIKILEDNFNSKPIVLFYDDLRNNPKDFVNKLARLLGVSVNNEELNLSRKHTSYSENQLKAIMAVGQFINLRKRRIFKNSVLHLFWRFYLGLVRYTTLYAAKFIPGRYFRKEPLISKDELNKVKKYYEADWEKCLAYPRK